MKVNFTKITIKDIDGNEKKSDFHKTIADLLYNHAKTVDFVEAAMEINKGRPVELTPTQLEEIKMLINTPINGVQPVLTHARKAFDDFYVSVLAEAQQVKD